MPIAAPVRPNQTRRIMATSSVQGEMIWMIRKRAMICQMMIRVMTASRMAPAVSMVFIRKSRIFSIDFPNPEDVPAGAVPAGWCAAFNPNPPIHDLENAVQLKMERICSALRNAFSYNKTSRVCQYLFQAMTLCRYSTLAFAILSAPYCMSNASTDSHPSYPVARRAAMIGS